MYYSLFIGRVLKLYVSMLAGKDRESILKTKAILKTAIFNQISPECVGYTKFKLNSFLENTSQGISFNLMIFYNQLRMMYRFCDLQKK